MRTAAIVPLTIDEALDKLRELISPAQQQPEKVAVAEALNMVIAQDTFSPIAVPGFANSAMDGYAVRHSDLQGDQTRLAVQGESLAGHPYNGTLAKASAVRIFTGAALPEGADTIIIQENTSRPSANSVLINGNSKAFAYVRNLGHDIAQGSLLLEKGTSLRPFELAAATTSGLTHVNVAPKLRIGVFATGDELKAPGTPLETGEIYESNRVAIISLLQNLPVEITNLGILPDNALATQNALTEAALNHDALITSGGVSVGDADFVRDAIETLGAVDFWRLNLRPGKPFAFGHINTATTDQATKKCLIFGLPGNPVSTIVTLLLLVKPALWHMAGASDAEQSLRQNAVRVPLAQPTAHSLGRHEYQRGRLEYSEGLTRVHTTSDQSSNRLQSFRTANCLFLLPGDVAELTEGDLVEVLPFSGLV